MFKVLRDSGSLCILCKRVQPSHFPPGLLTSAADDAAAPDDDAAAADAAAALWSLTALDW